MFSLKRVSFLTYDTADVIISSLEIIEKLLFPETHFWHDNYLKEIVLLYSTQSISPRYLLYLFSQDLTIEG